MAQFPNQFPPNQQWPQQPQQGQAPQPQPQQWQQPQQPMQQPPPQQQWAPPPPPQQAAPQQQWQQLPMQQPPQQQWQQPPMQQQAPPPPQTAPQGGSGPKLAPALPPQAYTFDLSEPSMSYEDREGFDYPPPGRYHLRVEAFTPTTNKQSEPQIACQYVIIEGPHQGKKFTVFYSLRKFSDRLRGMLDAAHGEGQGWDRRTGQFGHRIPETPGKTLYATLTLRTYTKNDGSEGTAADCRGHRPND